MAYRPGSVCNSILLRAKNEGVGINTLTLQKMLYFISSLYQRRTGENLVGERFEAWQYGPVVRSVYYEFRQFGSDPIPSYATYAGRATMVSRGKDPSFDRALDAVWDYASRLTPSQLVAITQLDGSAWSYAWDNHHAYLEPKRVAEDRSYDALLRI